MPKVATPLTATQIKNAKPKDNPYKLSDGKGLYLHVTPKGSKLWKMDFTLHAKRKTASFGEYPEVSLEQARERCLAARALIRDGIDPVQHKNHEQQAAKVEAFNTFEAVAWEWFEHHVKPKSPKHVSRTRAYLEHDLLPDLGKLPIASIEAPTLLECLRKIEARKNRDGANCTETANRVRSQMSALWRYAIATGKAKHDIAHDLRGALQKHVGENYSYITDPAVLGRLVHDVKTYKGQPVVKAALRLTPLVFQRPGELRNAKWSEIFFDSKEWRYIASKTKAEHVVPLSTQAIQILQDLQQFTGSREYVFAGIRGTRPISNNTVNKAFKRLGYSSDVIQPHGFRHTAATMLAERGWQEPEIERQLSHKAQGIKDVYQKAQYLPRRHEMMQEWANYLDELSLTHFVTN